MAVVYDNHSCNEPRINELKNQAMPPSDKKTNEWYVLPFMLVGLFIVGLILITDNKKSSEISRKMDVLYQVKLSGIVSTISQSRGLVSLRLKDSPQNPIYFSTTLLVR